jgi:hypothetical protein
MKDTLTIFQVIMVIFGALTLLGGIIGLYGYMKAEIAEINVHITNFRRELDMERTANMQSEKFNRDDHKEIMNKLNELMLK